MGAAEHVDGDGQLDLLGPAWAVVVVQHKRVVLISPRLTCTRCNIALQTSTHTFMHAHVRTHTHKVSKEVMHAAHQLLFSIEPGKPQANNSTIGKCENKPVMFV